MGLAAASAPEALAYDQPAPGRRAHRDTTHLTHPPGDTFVKASPGCLDSGQIALLASACPVAHQGVLNSTSAKKLLPLPVFGNVPAGVE